MKKSCIFLITLLILSISVFPARAGQQALNTQYSIPSSDQQLVEPFIELIGTHEGAAYKILVPDSWNGTLLVYARGFIYTGICEPRAAPYAHNNGENILMEDILLAQGYALAGSCYREINGAVVKDGIRDTLALTQLFIKKVGTPDQIIIYGTSMGSIIAFKLIEDYPNLYDAAIGACNLGAGLPKFVDMILAEALAYDMAFDWLDEWGPIGDVRDDITPTYFQQMIIPLLESHVANPENFGLLEFFRLVNGWTFDAFYSEGFLYQMGLALMVRSDLERRAGGPVAQNIDHVYKLTDSEKNYLASLGVNADELLLQMNAMTNIEASANARKYIENYGEFSGNLTRPVLTLHDIYDHAAIVSHNDAYKDTVTLAGNDDLLVQVYTDNDVHCNFTSHQINAAIAAMNEWLETGSAPDNSFFPETLGFVNSYTPPSWPRP